MVIIMRKPFILMACVFTLHSFGFLCGTSPAQELGKWWKNSSIVEVLELSGSQIVGIERTYLDHRKKLADLMNSLKKEEARLKSLMEINAADDARILDQAKRVAEARKNLEIAQTVMMLSFRKQLTDEQWKKLEEMREIRALSIESVLPDEEVSGTADAWKMFLPDGTEYYVTGKGVTAPVIIKESKPPYTAEAREAKTEGIVLLEAIVHKDGSVDNFKVLRSLGYGLDESAMKTIAEDWLFKPGMLNGQPVNIMVTIEISFSRY
jgi:TonB family protein